MKISRRCFIGASVLAAIPSFDVIGSVFSPEKPKFLVHEWSLKNQNVQEGSEIVWVSGVRCETLSDPEISINYWNRPSYKICLSVSSLSCGIKDFPIGNIIKNGVRFVDRNKKECLLVNSRGSRIVLSGFSFKIAADLVDSWKTIGGTACRVLLPKIEMIFQFDEVPSVIFQEKRATAEEIYGVGKFPSFGK